MRNFCTCITCTIYSNIYTTLYCILYTLYRIINVASNAHLFSNLDQTDLMLSKPNSYQPWIAYGNSKLANILFTKALASKLKAVNSPIITVSCHPGEYVCICMYELVYPRPYFLSYY